VHGQWKGVGRWYEVSVAAVGKKMMWLGRKRASRPALTCVVNQFDVSSRTGPCLCWCFVMCW
jgi:hypothetical protein